MAETLGSFFEYADEIDAEFATKLWRFFGKCHSWDTIELDGVVLALSLTLTSLPLEPMAQEIAAFFRFVDANPRTPVDPLVYQFFNCSPWDKINIGGRQIPANSITFWAVDRRYYSEGRSAEDQAARIAARFLDPSKRNGN